MFVSAVNYQLNVAVDHKRSSESGVAAASPDGLATARGNFSQPARTLAEWAGGSDTQARSVMERYNLRHISYTDLVNMADELRDAGALPPEEYLDFIGPSPEHASLTGEVIKGWNDPKDYVEQHERQLTFLRASGAEQRFIDFAAYQLALFRHFESLQS